MISHFREIITPLGFLFFFMDNVQRVVRVVSESTWEAIVIASKNVEIQKALNQWRHKYHLRDIVVTPIDLENSHLHCWRREK